MAPVKLCSVIVSFNRLELLKETIFSYAQTVTTPNRLIVVDNRSDQKTRRWLRNSGLEVIFLERNFFPGYATNRGWEKGIEDDTEFLHRSDSDFRYLPGWDQEVLSHFSDEQMGQVGLRTDAEEMDGAFNCGGNCIIRRSLWDQGIRYDERSWPQLRADLGDGHTEDSLMSPAIKHLGYRWTRVSRPTIQNLASGDWGDSYYAKSYGIRGITPHPDDPTAQHLK